jgi:hypothetical protein
VFLLRGQFGVRGQPGVAFAETGCAYRVKSEVMLNFYGEVTAVIMEEGDMKGRCRREAEESARMYRAVSEGNWWQRRRAKKAWDRRIEEKMAAARTLMRG